MLPDLPPSFQDLYRTSGPILRYRILRDVLDRDESWIETSTAQAAVQKHPRVLELTGQQLGNGSFGDRLSHTAACLLWLCEAGAESHPAIERALELVVLPTLAQENVTWELSAEQRPLVRDICLHMLARATRGTHPLLETYLELAKLDWQRWFENKRSQPPTVAAYCAMAWWRPPPAQTLEKRALIAKLLNEVENQPTALLPESSRLLIPDKEIYLTEPVRMLFDLEHGARAGVLNEVNHLRWLYDELEVAQDTDGMWHYEQPEVPLNLSWYFPLESEHSDNELTVRALMVYKLLNYDV